MQDLDAGGMSKTQLKAAKRAAKKAAKQKKKGSGTAEPEPVQEEEVGADGLLIGGPAAARHFRGHFRGAQWPRAKNDSRE
eukprot:COSAG04_NODE_1834_length_5448_cov_3.120396_4_plen_80_part_00